MLEEQGRIVAVEEGFAWVETQRQSACGACSANKGCGTGVISKVVGQRATRVRALNEINATTGDEVIIGLHDEALVRGSLAVYAVPLIAMLLMALLGDLAGRELNNSSEGLTVLFGLAGLGLGFLWVRNFSRRIADDPRYQPVILRRRQGGAAHETLIQIQGR
jgi:sigma-E factor negative regulatory protein RseC